MEMVKNAINWFEIPVADYSRAKKFYSTILDYEMPDMEMEGVKMGILPHEQGEGVGGAICCGEGYEPTQKGAKYYLNAGNDLNTILGRVANAGGQIILDKTPIGDNMGYFAFFLDSEGNQVGLHSTN